jgi:hypothetical protein
MDWLSPTKISSLHNNLKDRRTPGTGQWLLDSTKYKRWRHSPSGLLWLNGAGESVEKGSSGARNKLTWIKHSWVWKVRFVVRLPIGSNSLRSGKLMCPTSSAVIEDIQELYRNGPKKTLAYWYFQFSDEATQNVCNMIRSFIRQLSTSPLFDAVRRLWDEHKRRSSDPDIKELMGALDEIIDRLEEVFIVIDALDECPQTADRPERGRLLVCVRNLLGRHGKNLHLLATSRPEYDIDSELRGHTTVNIGAYMEDDIRHYLKNAVGSGNLKDWKDDIKREIEEKLLSTEEK